MTTAKPVAQTPASQSPRPPAAPLYGPPLAPKGLAFAHILAAHAPAFAPKTPNIPDAPTQAHASAETALPQAIRGLGEEPEKHGHKHDRGDDELNPSARQAAQLAPPMLGAQRNPAASAPAVTNARVSLEDLVPQLVKKIAWSGDAHRGTVRMELGAGELAGATLTVSAEMGA